MSEQQTPSMTPVDALLCDDQLQTIKACIPFLGLREQPVFLALTKFMEFQNSMHMIQTDTGRLAACSMEPAMRTPVHMLNHIRTYCSESQRSTIDSLLGGLQMVQMLQMMQGQSHEDSGNNNTADLLKSMLTEDQQQMFQKFSETVQKENPGEGGSYGRK